MPQDWFSANAPQAASSDDDWFATNAPTQSRQEPAQSRSIGADKQTRNNAAALQLLGVRPGAVGMPDPVWEGESGALSGLMSTAFRGGDLLRRGWNAVVPESMEVDRVVDTPEAQAAMTPPDSPAGKVGFMGEQIAEFAVPLSAAAKAAKGAPVLKRMAVEGAAGGGVAAVQSGGDTGMTTAGTAIGAVVPVVGAGLGAAGRAVQRAAAGAKEGGLGGAVASAVRTAAPAKPQRMMVQAIKPRAANAGFESALERAMPELKATEGALGRPIGGIDDLMEATKAAKKRVWSQYEEIAGAAKARGAQVDLSPVADAVARSIPKKALLKTPQRADALKQQANVYRSRFSLDEAEEFLKETNAELEAFYGKYPAAQRSALASDPIVAGLEAEARALRTAIDKTLDATGEGASARELKRRYGALLNVEREAFRRANVAKRQQPESLAEQIGNARAVGDIARGTWRVLHGDVTGAADIAAGHASRSAAKFMKEQQTTDALIRRAFEGFKGTPTPIIKPLPRRVSGLLESGPVVTPQPADPSFVRGVPAVPAQSSRRALPPGRNVRPMPAATLPDSSGGGSVPAAPIAYEMDPTVAVKPGGFRVAQFSGDPKAAKAAVATPEVQGMLTRMLDDLNEFRPQRGRMVRGEGVARDEYVYGVAGSPVGDDIRVISEQNVGNADIIKAIQDLLAGKTPTNRLHTGALDAAMGYLERRPGYRGPMLPEGVDEGFEAFSQAVDDIGGGASREAGEEGFIVPALAAKMGGGAAGGATGAAGDDENRLRGALLGAGAGALGMAALAKGAQKGIRAYHGSPHDFDKFSMSKIGTGEGAQAYGHGLYFAEREGTARAYRDQLSKFGHMSEMPEEMSTSVLLDNKVVSGRKPSNQLTPLERAALAKHYAGGLQQRAIQEIEDNLKYLTPDGPAYKQDLETLEILKTVDLAGRVRAFDGRMYEVDIKADPEEFLDWDKPLKDQPEFVKKALERDWLAHPEDHAHQTGRQIYNATAMGQRDVAIGRGRNQDTTMPAVQSAASKALKEAGIKGIKYLDAGSRGAGDGTRNYVVFDEEIIDILKKYGIVLPVAAAGAAEGRKRRQE